MHSTHKIEPEKRVKKGLKPQNFVLQTNKRPVLKDWRYGTYLKYLKNCIDKGTSKGYLRMINMR